MNVLTLFSIAVYAAEIIISPVPDELPGAQTAATAPPVSFGALTQTPPQPTPLPTPQATAGLPAGRQARKNHFTIAVIGDSMVDTLGPGVPNLKSNLTQRYPGVTFDIRNYGVGASNIDYGIQRLTHDYEYLGNHIPSLVSQHPDIVVIESFGYNPYPFDSGAIDRHWLALATMVDAIRGNLPEAKIVMAATIAPNWNVFGDGAPGVSFSDQAKREHVKVVKRYLENTVRFAQSQGLPLADAYHPSLQADGNGKIGYINGGDHIHYSDSGRELFGRVVAQTIVANKLLE